MQYTTQIQWSREGKDFSPQTYSRNHQIILGKHYQINASSAPEFSGDPTVANPEELFSAAISSCFMLTFLYLAAQKGIKIEDYKANTVGTLAKNAEGKISMTELIIRPSIKFLDDKKPEPQILQALLNKAHETCFISCSVKTTISIEHEKAMI